MFILKFVFYFALSFLILSIPIGENRVLFNSIHVAISPYADKFLHSTKDKINKTAYYSKKLYSNSEPQYTDKVRSKMAGLKKEADDVVIGFKEEVIDENGNPTYDHYDDDEEYRLRQIINED